MRQSSVLIKLTSVKLLLYDQTGRQIKEYQLGEKVAGSYRFTIDGSGLKPGVYFITLQTNGIASDTEKLG
ncbi:MAG: T9SS type A sorting domain-containing protein [Bacteroidales bacterium]|nr:T9SS type A sorting domain-containing protein [Bacteroidales bacterium]